MPPDFCTQEAAARADWIRAMQKAFGGAINDPGFDLRFVRYLTAALDRTGFANLADAVLRSFIDVANDRGSREELDGMIDLGIRL